MTDRSSCRAALMVAFALMAAACGSGEAEPEDTAAQATAPPVPTATAVADDTAAGDDAADPTPSSSEAPTSLPEPEPDAASDQEPSTPDDWLLEMSEALIELRRGTGWAFVEYTAALKSTPFDPVIESAYDGQSGDAYAAFLNALPTPPPGLAEAQQAFVMAASAVRDDLWAVADEWDASPDAPGESGDTHNGYWARREQATIDFEVACLAFQGAFADMHEGELIDCTGERDPQRDDLTPEECLTLEEAFGEGLIPACSGDAPPDDGDPSTAEYGQSQVAAGQRIVFDDLPVPFAVTALRDYDIAVTDTSVEIRPSENPWFEEQFLVAWLDEIADPAAMPEQLFAFGPTVDAPEDLGEWIADLPIRAVSQGTSTFGEVEAPWWRLEPAGEPLTEEDFVSYAWTDTGVSPVTVLRRDTVFWQIPHDDGLLVVFAIAVNENPEAVSMDEKFAFVEAALASLELRG